MEVEGMYCCRVQEEYEAQPKAAVLRPAADCPFGRGVGRELATQAHIPFTFTAKERKST